MSRKKNYENFPLSLALFDALPVIFFSASMLVIGASYRNPLFLDFLLKIQYTVKRSSEGELFEETIAG